MLLESRKKCIEIGYTWVTDEYTQEDLGEIEEFKVFENQSELSYFYLLPIFVSITKQVEKNIIESSPSFKRDEIIFFFQYFIKKEFESAFFK